MSTERACNPGLAPRNPAAAPTATTRANSAPGCFSDGVASSQGKGGGAGRIAVPQLAMGGSSPWLSHGGGTLHGGSKDGRKGCAGGHAHQLRKYFLQVLWLNCRVVLNLGLHGSTGACLCAPRATPRQSGDDRTLAPAQRATAATMITPRGRRHGAACARSDVRGGAAAAPRLRLTFDEAAHEIRGQLQGIVVDWPWAKETQERRISARQRRECMGTTRTQRLAVCSSVRRRALWLRRQTRDKPLVFALHSFFIIRCTMTCTTGGARHAS